MLPMRFPCQVLPKDWAASSTTRSRCFLAMAYSRSRSTGRPARSTGRIARVAGVMAASTRARSMLRVAGSISTKIGRAPTSRTTLLVATQESGVVMTSWPDPTPAMRSAISIVQVPELKARTGRPPQYSESFASKAFTCGPEVIQPERSTSATPAIVSSSMVGRVKGRKGTAAAGGGVAVGVEGADISGLVAEQRMILGLFDQIITERRIGKEFLRIFRPGDHPEAPRLLPPTAELCVGDEAPARSRRGILFQLQFAGVGDQLDQERGREGEVSEYILVIHH